MSFPTDGFLYVAHDAHGVTADAAEGAVLRLPARQPPWIAVYHDLDGVGVARWPGRLWRVEVLDTEGIEQVSPRAHFTRAAAVRVLDEVPAWRLFGKHGQAVAAVIAAASRLELDDVETLARSRHPDAGRAYARAWKRWLASLGVGGADVGDDLDGTLEIPVKGRGSPINAGFSVLSYAVYARAEQLVGPAAFVTSADGERWLDRTWSSAACALLETAMSFGSPESSREDAPTLAAAWRAVVER